MITPSTALLDPMESPAAVAAEIGEQVAGFRIDDDDLEDLKTVRDAVDYVVAKLGNAS